ncbi:FHA domain-containing protein [Microlunatus elymi]|uniref:FHA domain-containing protein n=1 Tax=Microlunatus elymi TaxID=2596828 RepID=A0A516PZT8_9ACTN|nr:FHA domain-containing protein [Microlunatus elymi]QDP96684.1 FHA domain-containing protein [Microlunatus elymi]
MIYCTNCGHQNSDRANFCSQCGTALERPQRQAEDTREADPQSGDARGSDARVGDTTRTMPAMPEEREGSRLSDDDEEAVNALPHGSALLIVRRGADAGSRFLLDTEVSTVGRSQDADILLDDISVSRRHATFTRTDQGVVVRDVGSLNGTYVNRQMVDEQLLQAGDEVQIGKFRLVFYAARS